jgi:hypothetical protein
MMVGAGEARRQEFGEHPRMRPGQPPALPGAPSIRLEGLAVTTLPRARVMRAGVM